MTGQVDYKEISKELALDLVQTQKALQQSGEQFQKFAYDIAKSLELDDEALQSMKIEDLVEVVADLKQEYNEISLSQDSKEE